MKHRIHQGFTLIELLVVITIIALLAGLAMPVFSTIQQKANLTKGISNCRQILIACKAFASDQSGSYPDQAAAGGASSGTISDANTAFRQLFTGGYLSDERIFGCPASTANPDGNIGTAPNYTSAVMAGENHWALTAGLNDSASASYPIIMEEFSSPGNFNPKWDTTKIAVNGTGRVWSGPSIIIGLNDGSANKMAVSTTDGTLATQGAGGSTNQFTMNTQGGGNAPTILIPTSSGGSGGSGG